MESYTLSISTSTPYLAEDQMKQNKSNTGDLTTERQLSNLVLSQLDLKNQQDEKERQTDQTFPYNSCRIRWYQMNSSYRARHQTSETLKQTISSPSCESINQSNDCDCCTTKSQLPLNELIRGTIFRVGASIFSDQSESIETTIHPQADIHT